MPYCFIAGIDTGIGKTYVTGLMARYLLGRGESVVTQKIVQTGCEGFSEDISVHRRMMGIVPLPEDNDLACPYILPFPASPHLAARLAGVDLDAGRIAQAAEELSRRYEYVLVEGCGGLLVPLNGETTQLDYIEARGYPVVLVSPSRLGSINHAMLSLEALRGRNIPVRGIVYNLHPGAHPHIEDDTRQLLVRRLRRLDYPDTVIDLPPFGMDKLPDVDFSRIFS